MLGKYELLSDLEAQAKGCEKCPLHCHRKNVVFGQGSPYAELMFIGEAPGEWEDASGEPFVGRAGQLLNGVIKALGYERKDVYIANIVKCRPPSNRDPTPVETQACRSLVDEQIRAVSPKIIVTLGRVASQVLLEDTTGITKMRGEWRTISPLDWEEIPVMPTFHPAYILRNPAAKKELREDMMKVKNRLREPHGTTNKDTSNRDVDSQGQGHWTDDREKAQETIQAF